jgi:hypothetical protein
MSEPLKNLENSPDELDTTREAPPGISGREEKEPWEERIENFLFTPRKRSTQRVKAFLNDWVRRYNRM